MIAFSSPYRSFLIAAAVFTGCFFISACENSQAEIDELTRNEVMKEEATGVVSYLSQEGRMRARLTAPLMYRVLAETTYVEFPKTLHVDFFGDSSRVDSRLDCRYGKYFESQDKVYLRDSVILISVQGDTLKCQDLWWDQATQKFYTDKFAEYHARDKTIMGGKGLEATQDMTTVTFREPVGTVLTSGENGLQ